MEPTQASAACAQAYNPKTGISKQLGAYTDTERCRLNILTQQLQINTQNDPPTLSDFWKIASILTLIIFAI